MRPNLQLAFLAAVVTLVGNVRTLSGVEQDSTPQSIKITESARIRSESSTAPIGDISGTCQRRQNIGDRPPRPADLSLAARLLN